MKKRIHFGRIYTEFKSHVRITDYFTVLINRFPIIIIRYYDFNLHDEDQKNVKSFGILGITLSIPY
jgi:hypothetical protein